MISLLNYLGNEAHTSWKYAQFTTTTRSNTIDTNWSDTFLHYIIFINSVLSTNNVPCRTHICEKETHAPWHSRSCGDRGGNSTLAAEACIHTTTARASSQRNIPRSLHIFFFSERNPGQSGYCLYQLICHAT